MSVAEAIVATLANYGVRHIFGVPGGECNLDLIAAADKLGVDFVLTRTETAAVIMASIAGELTGSLGTAITTRGPGFASAINGLAFAHLDRAPLLIIADGYDAGEAFVSHQRINQEKVAEPLVRHFEKLEADRVGAQLRALLTAATSCPPGAVYLEVTGSQIRADTSGPVTVSAERSLSSPDDQATARVRNLLTEAKRPIVIAGLQARSRDASSALRFFVSETGCPVLTTYKAKGTMPESHPLAIGLYAGGVAEEPLIRESDLILLYGFDPVEGPPQQWRYPEIPTIELTEKAFPIPLVTPSVSVVGPIGDALRAIAASVDSSGWLDTRLTAHRTRIRSAPRAGTPRGLTPAMVVDSAMKHLPRDSRITIDAGAHMLPVLHLWECAEPNQSLISRGLSTMGFALPAAIAASLADPQRKTVAFTGDGGLMICLGELGTARESGAKPLVVVFNDSALTLIEAKQRRRQLPRSGVTFDRTSFCKIAEGFGWQARGASSQKEIDDAFREAAAADEPFLIDAYIDPGTYDDIIAAVRG